MSGLFAVANLSISFAQGKIGGSLGSEDSGMQHLSASKIGRLSVTGKNGKQSVRRTRDCVEFETVAFVLCRSGFQPDGTAHDRVRQESLTDLGPFEK